MHGRQNRNRLLPADGELSGKDFAGQNSRRFLQREGRPTEKRFLHRALSTVDTPALRKGFRNETQVVCTVLSHDLENDPDVVAMIGASAALTISGVPFLGPIAACRVGYKDGEYILNPRQSDLPDSDLDLVLAGTQEGVLMVVHGFELSEDHARCCDIWP